MNGIRTLADLKDRSVVDGACWLYGGAKSRHGRPVVWHPDLCKTMSLGSFLSLVTTGERPPKGLEWRTTCGIAACCAPAHQELRPKGRPGPIAPLHRARIAKAHRARSSRLSPEAVEYIRSSGETGIALAPRLGISPQMVSLIRRNEAWAPIGPWA